MESIQPGSVGGAGWTAGPAEHAVPATATTAAPSGMPQCVRLRLAEPASVNRRSRDRTAGRCYTETMPRALARAAACLLVLGLFSVTFGAVAPPHAAAQEASRRAWLGVALDKGASGGVLAKHCLLYTSPSPRD